MEPVLRGATKAPQNCRNSPPVITVVFRELLNEAEHIYFTSIDANANTGQGGLIEVLKVLQQTRSKLDEFMYCDIAGAREIGAFFWPGANSHRLKSRAVFPQNTTDAQRIEITIAVSDVP